MEAGNIWDIKDIDPDTIIKMHLHEGWLMVYKTNNNEKMMAFTQRTLADIYDEVMTSSATMITKLKTAI